MLSVYDATSCPEYKKRIALKKNGDTQSVDLNPDSSISEPAISESNSSNENGDTVGPAMGIFVAGFRSFLFSLWALALWQVSLCP